MNLIKILRFLYKSEDSHFLSVDKETYLKYKWLIILSVFMNKKYKSCEIYRKKYKMMEDFVVVGLRYSGRNVKRRTSGYAKEFIDKNKYAKCLYCESKLNDGNATADHIIPISRGGNNTQINLVVCCKNCNNERGNMDFNEYLRLKNVKYKKVKRLFV